MIFNPEIAKSLAAEMTLALRKRLLEQGHKATGRGVKSLETRIVPSGDGLLISILGEDYLEFQETGRRKGSFPPISALEKWVKQKGIASGKKAKSIAFAIAKNMQTIGMHSTNKRLDLTKRKFISSTIDRKAKVIQDKLFQMFEKNFDLIVTQLSKGIQTKTIIKL